jgi:hypothetical protein
MGGMLVLGGGTEPLAQAFPHQDKLHHLLGFAVFAYSLRFAFPSLGLLRSVIAGLAVALAIEAMQHWLPGRTSSLGDMAANIAGLLLGAWLAKAPAPPAETLAANAAVKESQMPGQGN